MTGGHKSIKRQLMTVMLLITGAVMILTYVSFISYEYIDFRQDTVRELSTLGQIMASNSTGSLAFENKEDAAEILAALRAERHIVGAGLYGKDGKLFYNYPDSLPVTAFPAHAGVAGFNFENDYLAGFQPVVLGGKTIGMLYLKSDMDAMVEKFKLYFGLTMAIGSASLLMAWVLSQKLGQRMLKPILGLAGTAKDITGLGDFSVRATKMSQDEVGELTESFNLMLDRIQQQNQEIKAFTQVLEQKVLERTEEMQMVNKELEAFSYSISHDLRAPLRSIIGYSQVLMEDYGAKMDEEGQRLCNVITHNGKRMGQLIDDLLDFSRLGRKELQRTYVDMNALVNEIIQEQTALENGRKLDIQVSPMESTKVDRNMMTQVWVNLISNALKYSRKKEITQIEIGSRKENGQLYFYIKDNGAGFDMLYVDKLFGVFQRLHKMNEFEGTGVGLALVKRIIQRHGGDVWAESAVGQGAKFTFTLPNS